MIEGSKYGNLLTGKRLGYAYCRMFRIGVLPHTVIYPLRLLRLGGEGELCGWMLQMAEVVWNDEIKSTRSYKPP